jgi:uncharacterized cupredoxin-like copper-binding protein
MGRSRKAEDSRFKFAATSKHRSKQKNRKAALFYCYCGNTFPLAMFVSVTEIAGLHSEHGSAESVLVAPGWTRMPVVQFVKTGRVHVELT